MLNVLVHSKLGSGGQYLLFLLQLHIFALPPKAPQDTNANCKSAFVLMEKAFLYTVGNSFIHRKINSSITEASIHYQTRQF